MKKTTKRTTRPHLARRTLNGEPIIRVEKSATRQWTLLREYCDPITGERTGRTELEECLGAPDTFTPRLVRARSFHEPGKYAVNYTGADGTPVSLTVEAPGATIEPTPEELRIERAMSSTHVICPLPGTKMKLAIRKDGYAKAIAGDAKSVAAIDKDYPGCVRYIPAIAAQVERHEYDARHAAGSRKRDAVRWLTTALGLSLNVLNDKRMVCLPKATSLQLKACCGFYQDCVKMKTMYKHLFDICGDSTTAERDLMKLQPELDSQLLRTPTRRDWVKTILSTEPREAVYVITMAVLGVSERIIRQLLLRDVPEWRARRTLHAAAVAVAEAHKRVAGI